MNPYSLVYREQQQLFIYNSDYILGTLEQAGGASTLAGRFLVQFFGTPAIALIITLACLAGLCFLLRRHFPAILAPILFLAVSLGDNFLQFEVLIALALAFACHAIWENSANKTVLGPLAAVLLFPLAGSASFLFTLCCAASAIGRRRDILPALLTLATGFAVAWIAYLLCCVPTLGTALSPAFYYNVAETIPALHWVFWLGFPLALFLSEFCRTILSRPVFLATSVAFVLTALCLCIRPFNVMNHSVRRYLAEFEYFCSKSDWVQLEKASLPFINQPVAANFHNLALARQGKLFDDLMSRRQNGPHDLVFLPTDKSANTSLPYIMYYIGNVAAAENVAYNLAFTYSGYAPSMLKILADAEIMRGCYKVAEKYLEPLSHSLLYHSWAEERRHFLYKDGEVEADPVLGQGRRSIPESDGFAMYGSPMDEIYSIVRENPSNAAAMEYGLACLLLCKDVGNVVRLVRDYYGSSGLQKLPVYVQEALIFFEEYQRNVGMDEEFLYLTENWCLQHGVDFVTIGRLHDFQQACLNAGGRAPARYHNTYWYYLIYDNITSGLGDGSGQNPVY